MWKTGGLFDRLLGLTGVLPGIIVALLAVGVAAEVVARNFGLSGFYWMLEAVEYGLLTLTMVGAAYILSIGRHVTVDLVLSALPPRVYRRFRIGINLVIVMAAAVIVYFGAVTTISHGSRTPRSTSPSTSRNGSRWRWCRAGWRCSSSRRCAS